MTGAIELLSARALRDEALAIVKADLDIVKLEVSPSRMKERALDEAVDVLDTARDIASDNKTLIGAMLAALIAWFFREPLQDIGRDALNKVRNGDRHGR